MISLVIPIYRNEDNLDRLLAELGSLQHRLPDELEVVFVVDGSPDRSLTILPERPASASLRRPFVSPGPDFRFFRCVIGRLAGRAGQQVCCPASCLEEAAELLLQFHEVLKSGSADIVFGCRTKRSDPWLSEMASRLFWWIYRTLVVKEMPKGGVDVFACSREVRDHILKFREVNTNLIALLFWLGFRRHYLPYERARRREGKSAWTFALKLEYCLNSIFNFTDLPVRFLLIAGSSG